MPIEPPQLQYVGPTSNVNDHRVYHAAKGLANVWTAAIVAGLAVVMTGSVAYASAQASTERTNEQNAQALQQQVLVLTQRLDDLEAKLDMLTVRMK